MKNDHTNYHPASNAPGPDANQRGGRPLISQNPNSPFTIPASESAYGGSALESGEPENGGSGRQRVRIPGGPATGTGGGKSSRSRKQARPEAPGQDGNRGGKGGSGAVQSAEGRIAPELLGLVFILLSALLFISLASFDPADPGLNHVVRGGVPVKNWAGQFGAYLSSFLLDMLGFAAYVPFAFLCTVGARLCMRAPGWPWWRWCGFILLTCCLAVAAELLGLGIGEARTGGLLGDFLGSVSLQYFNPIGSALIWSFLFLLVLQMLLGFSWRQLTLKAARALRESFAAEERPGNPQSAREELARPRATEPDPASENGAAYGGSSPGGARGAAAENFPPDGPFYASEEEENAALERLVAQVPADKLVGRREGEAGDGPPSLEIPPGIGVDYGDGERAGRSGGALFSRLLGRLKGSGNADGRGCADTAGVGEENGLTVVQGQPLAVPDGRNGRKAERSPTGMLMGQDDGSVRKILAATPPETPDEFAEQPLWLADLEAGRIGVHPEASRQWDEAAERAEGGAQAGPGASLEPVSGASAASAPRSGGASSSSAVPFAASGASGSLAASDAGGRIASGAASGRKGPAPNALADERHVEELAEDYAGDGDFSDDVPGSGASGEEDYAEIFPDDIHIDEAYQEPRPKAQPRRIPAKLPPLELLQPVSTSNAISRDELEAKGRALMTCFRDFSIQAQLVRISPGPVVTSFEVRPAPGVKASRITNLSDDLALSLKAVSVRIQAPIPGTDTVGIEIPNERREVVGLRDLLASPVFQESDQALSMALGKDISGVPTISDLARMPHMLVAGATGTGKSVFLNSVLLSFLYRCRPEDLKLLLVDPKRIEMAVYADLPHLVHPIVTEMSLAKNALDWAVAEMERRYSDIARLGVRNVASYNQKLKDMGDNRPSSLADLQPMPYLVVIIDELADLMLTAGKEVETSIVRLAQLARAAGIHLIIATQRPSVDVVTGLIKANFPCRISFQVTSKHDSRTILDGVGAEHLLGRGDMLFKPAGGRLQRLHGAFVPDDDVAAVADYWRMQQKPDYQVDFAEWGAESDGGGNGGGGGANDDISRDPVYNEAVDFVRSQGKASISLIQRRFRIGFNRAARYIEQMEQDGIIGPADGSKPRMVR